MAIKVAIIGGGAAGFFAAISCYEALRNSGIQDSAFDIVIYEKGTSPLRKVKISGGGRCNVTHNEPDPKRLTNFYPRGRRELISPFQKFATQDTLEWFKEKGITIVAEEDGRMFPETNSSQTIIDCFLKTIEKYGIRLQLKSTLQDIIPYQNGYHLHLSKDQDPLYFDYVLLATGSDKSGHALTKGLGHELSEMAPSLFTFKVKDPLLKDLAGTTLPNVIVKLNIEKLKFEEKGPLLITHWGLSGPSILKISSWAARELKRVHYHFSFTLNLLGLPLVEIEKLIEALGRENPKKLLGNTVPKSMTKRFWEQFLQCYFKDLESKKWLEVSEKAKRKLAEKIYALTLESHGQHRYKEEFVECGGVVSKEVNFKNMESKVTSNLFFAGELLDVDGVTGGFNFQNAWTTGFVGGQEIAHRIIKKIEKS